MEQIEKQRKQAEDLDITKNFKMPTTQRIMSVSKDKMRTNTQSNKTLQLKTSFKSNSNNRMSQEDNRKFTSPVIRNSKRNLFRVGGNNAGGGVRIPRGAFATTEPN